MVDGSWLKAQGSRLKGQGSRLKAHGSWLKALSKAWDSLIENRTVCRIYQIPISCFLIDIKYISKIVRDLHMFWDFIWHPIERRFKNGFFTTICLQQFCLLQSIKAWPEEHASKNMGPCIFWYYFALRGIHREI